MDYATAITAAIYFAAGIGLVIVAVVVKGAFRDQVWAKILKKGARKRDEVDEILAQPAAKGDELLARMRARTKRRVRKPVDK